MLFHWDHVEFNEAYGPGDIIAEADNVSDARQNALDHIYLDIYRGEDHDWRDKEDTDSLYSIAKADLAKEPRILGRYGVVVIRGSD